MSTGFVVIMLATHTLIQHSLVIYKWWFEFNGLGLGSKIALVHTGYLLFYDKTINLSEGFYPKVG